ncbi:hypothetical protein ACF061_00555 [Streptomyces sp. NPDC015220]|uniref:hypothetical protein n=1 Tax=Streptomyces sp. NPDC015220 TaxID=3364947 RepID=UPI0036F98E15
MSELFGINPSDIGLGALLTLVVLLILRGGLVPRRTHEDLLADRDNWRSAFMESEKARAVEHEQVEELLELAKLGGHILTALPRPGQADEEEVNADARMDPAPRTRL